MPRAATVDERKPAALVLWDIVDESLDEADFLWRCREAAREAHDRTPDDVEGGIEDRLLGAIEGLCAPDAAAVDRVLTPALGSDDPSLVAVAAHALLVGGTEEGAAGFKAAFLLSAGARLEALRRGLELVATPGVFVGLTSAMTDASDSVRAAFLDACSFRALSLEPRLGDLLTGASPELQRAAARLLCHASPADREAWLPRALDLSDRRAREAAVTTGLVVGAHGAWATCREMATADILGSDLLLVPLAMSGVRRDHDLVSIALGKSQRQRAALWALGFGGRRSGADACVEMLAQDRHVRLAAEALVAITGLDLHGAGLVAPVSLPASPDDGEPPAFEDEDLDADLVPAAEDRLPLPDVPGVIRWWNRNRARFDPDTRHLGGRPASVGLVVDALARGPMRRRDALAFELAVRTRGRFQLEARGFLAAQRRRLRAFAGPSFGARSVDTCSADARASETIEGSSLSQETSPRGGR